MEEAFSRLRNKLVEIKIPHENISLSELAAEGRQEYLDAVVKQFVLISLVEFDYQPNFTKTEFKFDLSPAMTIRKIAFVLHFIDECYKLHNSFVLKNQARRRSHQSMVLSSGDGLPSPYAAACSSLVSMSTASPPSKMDTRSPPHSTQSPPPLSAHSPPPPHASAAVVAPSSPCASPHLSHHSYHHHFQYPPDASNGAPSPSSSHSRLPALTPAMVDALPALPSADPVCLPPKSPQPSIDASPPLSGRSLSTSPVPVYFAPSLLASPQPVPTSGGCSVAAPRPHTPHASVGHTHSQHIAATAAAACDAPPLSGVSPHFRSPLAAAPTSPRQPGPGARSTRVSWDSQGATVSEACTALHNSPRAPLPAASPSPVSSASGSGAALSSSISSSRSPPPLLRCTSSREAPFSPPGPHPVPAARDNSPAVPAGGNSLPPRGSPGPLSRRSVRSPAVSPPRLSTPPPPNDTAAGSAVVGQATPPDAIADPDGEHPGTPSQMALAMARLDELPDAPQDAYHAVFDGLVTIATTQPALPPPRLPPQQPPAGPLLRRAAAVAAGNCDGAAVAPECVTAVELRSEVGLLPETEFVAPLECLKGLPLPGTAIPTRGVASGAGTDPVSRTSGPSQSLEPLGSAVETAEASKECGGRAGRGGQR